MRINDDLMSRHYFRELRLQQLRGLIAVVETGSFSVPPNGLISPGHRVLSSRGQRLCELKNSIGVELSCRPARVCGRWIGNRRQSALEKPTVILREAQRLG